MKKQGILIILLFVTCRLLGQQDPLYTQYMTNPLTINPSIAGLSGKHNVSLISRKQWLGIDGAPTTIALSYQGPYFNDQVGLGANLIHDRLGPVVQTALYMDYAYKLLLDENSNSRLSFGLMGGFNYYTYNLMSLTYSGVDDDIPIDGYDQRFLMNFGFGLSYYQPKFFFGVSVPKILRNSLSDEGNTLTMEDKEERHYFTMAGVVFVLSESLKFKPSVIARGVNGASVSFDLNATFVLDDKIWLGALYRYNNAIGAIVRWQVNEKLHIGYSYDFSVNSLQGYNCGTHEVFFSFDIGPKDGLKSTIPFF